MPTPLAAEASRQRAPSPAGLDERRRGDAEEHRHAEQVVRLALAASSPRAALARRVAEDRVGAERARAQQADRSRADQPTPRRPSPTAPASSSVPATAKLARCCQPRGPRANALTGWRSGS